MWCKSLVIFVFQLLILNKVKNKDENGSNFKHTWYYFMRKMNFLCL